MTIDIEACPSCGRATDLIFCPGCVADAREYERLNDLGL